MERLISNEIANLLVDLSWNREQEIKRTLYRRVGKTEITKKLLQDHSYLVRNPWNFDNVEVSLQDSKCWYEPFGAYFSETKFFKRMERS